MYRIMVIDDDEPLGVRVVQALEKAGFRAQFYGRTFGVLNAIREAACDVVVLDVNMPRLDGKTIARMVRDALGASCIRVLLYSSMDLRLLERVAVSVGAHGAVSKQAPEEELIERIKELLAKKSRAGAGSSTETNSN